MKIDLKDEFKDLPANTIAENLIRLRKLNNLTQKELSCAVGIDKSNISKYERGELFPTKKASIILSDFFNLDTKYFYDDYFEKIDNFEEYLSDFLNGYSTISKNELCKLIGISKRTLYRYYYGNDVPSRNIFLKIQKYIIKD